MSNGPSACSTPRRTLTVTLPYLKKLPRPSPGRSGSANTCPPPPHSAWARLPRPSSIVSSERCARFTRPGRFALKRFPMYVNGQFVPAKSGKWFPVYDPSTEEVIAELPDSNAEDVDAAAAAARQAFESGPWPKTTPQDRGRVLFRLAEKIRMEAARLAELESRNCGKPIVESEYDVADAATCFEYYGGLATKVIGQVNPVPANALSLSMREPAGVAGPIISWN